MTTNGARLLAAPVREGGTPTDRWLPWEYRAGVEQRFPELDVSDCPALLLVAAHADDETLGLGCLAAMLGEKVQVVCATDTEGVDRRSELVEACECLGVPEPICLGLPDGQLPQHVRELGERLAALLDQGDWVAAPWRGDGHPDHEAAGEAALWAARKVDCFYLEYPVWMWHWAVPDDPDVPWEDVARVATQPEAWSKKRKAVSRYVSQIQGDNPVLPPAVVRRALMLREVVFT